MTFFDCSGVRLLLEKARGSAPPLSGACLNFRCADAPLAVGELKRRGVLFLADPHLIARTDDHDLWMAFPSDPDGHRLGLMQEASKGWTPPKSPTSLLRAGGPGRARRNAPGAGPPAPPESA